MRPDFPIPDVINRLPLGEVFQYLLSTEWGKSPEPSIEGEMLIEADHNVHCEKPKTGKDESENER
jgi:hypothetical protein